MSLILAIETSTDVCSVALLSDGELRADATVNRQHVHGERLTTLIERVIDDADTDPGSLDAIAISAGPGSYTGLRIGVSTAKGLAFAHDVPVISVPSLEVVAHEAAECASAGDTIAVVRGARSHEVYCSVFAVSVDETGLPTCQCEQAAAVVPLDMVEAELPSASDNTLWLAGDAGRRVREKIGREARLFDPQRPSPTGYWVGRAAMRHFAERTFADLATFEPEYIRPFHTHERKPIFD